MLSFRRKTLLCVLIPIIALMLVIFSKQNLFFNRDPADPSQAKSDSLPVVVDRDRLDAISEVGAQIERPSIVAEMTASFSGINASSSGGDLQLSNLPQLVKFSSVGSWSSNDEKLSSTWTIAERVTRGDTIYHVFTKPGVYPIELKLKGENGAELIEKMSIDASKIDCLDIVDNICPIFKNHQDAILAVSESEWQLSTGLSTPLKDVKSQAENEDRWITLTQTGSGLKFDISDVASISGSNINLNRERLLAKEIDPSQPYKISLRLIDIKGEGHQGSSSNFFFGYGSADLKGIPPGAVVDVLNVRAQYYRQFEGQSSISLRDLPAGSFKVSVSLDDDFWSKYFEIDRTSPVTLDLSKPISAKTKNEYSAVEIPKWLNGDKTLEHYREKFRRAHAGTNYVSEPASFPGDASHEFAETNYPEWTRQCNNTFPTHVPVYNSNRNEFSDSDDEGAVWIPAAFEWGAGLEGEFSRFTPVPREAFGLSGGRRSIRLLCFVHGFNHREVEESKHLEDYRCCSRIDNDLESNCRNNVRRQYHERVERPSVLDATPVHFTFKILDVVTKQITRTQVSESFLSAQKSGAADYRGIAQEFGIVAPVTTSGGILAPSFFVYVPVPEKIITPVLAIELDGPPRSSDQRSAYGFGCYLAQKYKGRRIRK
jgi:hypothetical protein